MAPRSSVYSNALKLPEWVFGGDYGDLSTLMNNRDKSYETTEQARQLTESNQYKLDAAEKAQAFSDLVGEQFQGDSQPKTLRDAYQRMIQAANESGNPLEGVDLLEKVDNLERQSSKDRLVDLNSARDFADTGSTDLVRSFLPPEFQDQAETMVESRRSKGRGNGKESTMDMYDLTSGILIPDVPIIAAVKAQMSGRAIPANDPRVKSGEIQLPSFPGTEKPKPEEGGGFWDFFSSNSKPGEAPVKEQQKLVDDIGRQATEFTTFRNKKTGEEVKLPKGQRPR